MINLNTNLSSLITQNSLKQSTNRLNQAIERMTTGFKINHAKDNAANYNIVTNMTTKIGALDVAEDNSSQALDLISTASDNLSLIQDRVQRLRDLQVQASNGTYGEESLLAINAECNSLVDEINRLYLSTNYNGINMFLEAKTDEQGNTFVASETTATKDTSFEELGIVSSTFSVYDIDNNEVQAYDIEENDTIQDFFEVLNTHGFSTKIQNGEIIISSVAGNYIKGDLADKLGLSTYEQDYVKSATQGFEEEQIFTFNTYNTTTLTTTSTNTIVNTETTFDTQHISTTKVETTSQTQIISTTTVTQSETVTTNYVVQTASLIVTQTREFLETITQQDTSTMTALSTMSSTTELVSGTYKISTTGELQQLATITNNGYLNVINSYKFVLAKDLDLSTIDNWTPIGNSTNNFFGTFDGNGYKISNLTINTTEDNQGLFGVASSQTYIKNDNPYSRDCIINNLGLNNVNIQGGESVGGLVGQAEGTAITNCYVIGNISGTSNLGGIVGTARAHAITAANVSDSWSSGTVTATGSNVGGLVGESLLSGVGSYNSCFSVCKVSGNSYSGALFGSSDDYNAIFNTTYNSTINPTLKPLGDSSSIPSGITDDTTLEVSQGSSTATLSTTLDDLGISGDTEFSLPNGNKTFASTTSLQDLINQIKSDSAVSNAELIDGVLLITTTNVALDLSTGFLSSFSPTQTSNTTTFISSQTRPVEYTTVIDSYTTVPWEYTTVIENTTTTTTFVTNTVTTTNVTTTTVSNTLSLSGSTKFEDLGLENILHVTIYSEGTKSTITITKDNTFDEFYVELENRGITKSISGGRVVLTGNGNTYINSRNLIDLISIDNVTQNMATKLLNTESDTQICYQKLEGIYAPGAVSIQVGSGVDVNSQINVKTAFSMSGYHEFRNIGIDNKNYLEQLDKLLEDLNTRQIEFGATQNRLISALEEISIQKENLISSRSTLRDADISEVSSMYIQQQILQQASATLMATANQSPSIALQLIQ